MRTIQMILLLLLALQLLQAQDKAKYDEKFIWDRERTILTADFSDVEHPELADFERKVFHFDPIRQDTAGTCWAFASTSFIESEIYRLHDKKIKLSELYTVFWEYVEKARRFIKEEGDSRFGQGSEANATLLRMKQYGCVPAEAYTGLLDDQTVHNHEQMFKEMRDYLRYLKDYDYWDETVALNQIKTILVKYMGEPPNSFKYEGQIYTPKLFLKEVCQINPDDYVGFMSTLKTPFYEKGEFDVPDNWWHSDDYHNIPLDDFYQAIKSSIQNGYSVCIGGDVSEPGKYGWEDIAVVVPWDIKSEDIDQSARELRFYNKTTTDDHGVHLVGYTEQNGRDWFLIKDSGSSSHYGDYKGYYFFRGDFVKLKMLTFMVHKDAVESLLQQF